MRAVEEHYSGDDLLERILAGLEAAGADIGALTVADLAPVDAFHIRGRAATEELAGLAQIAAGQRVLDAGCGIGGTSRYLAAELGCAVSGVDLSGDYCRVAEQLSARVGLADRVGFHRGSVLELPFEDDYFDVAWTEHAQMNIADKAGFYAELHRVLKTGGRLAFHDVFAGPVGEPYFPVPWAPDDSISHLVTIEELRDTLASTGFSQAIWEDKTAASAEFFDAALQRMQQGQAGRPGLGLLMEDAQTKFQNVFRSLKEGRVCVVRAVMKKTKQGERHGRRSPHGRNRRRHRGYYRGWVVCPGRL